MHNVIMVIVKARLIIVFRDKILVKSIMEFKVSNKDLLYI